MIFTWDTNRYSYNLLQNNRIEISVNHIRKITYYEIARNDEGDDNPSLGYNVNHGLGHIQDLYPTIQTYELIGNNIKITTNGDYETGLPNTTFRILEEGNKLHYLKDGQLGKLYWSGADMIFSWDSTRGLYILLETYTTSWSIRIYL